MFLSSSILHSNELIDFKSKKIEINLFFDTPFILALQGIDGDTCKKACLEFLKNLTGQGAKLFVFEHTFDEIDSLYTYCKNYIDRSKYDPVKAKKILKHFISMGFKKFDIEKVQAKLESDLKSFNISIYPALDPNIDKEYNVNMEALYEKINHYYKHNTINYDEFEKKNTIENDVKSISSIYKLRKGKKHRTIKDVGFVFVTPNETLAGLSKKYEYKEKILFIIPACVTDVFIGTVFWLNSPINLSSLNAMRLIADCFAALKPDKTMIEKITNEAEKLLKDKTITKEHYLLIRESVIIEDIIMAKTVGNPDNFEEGKTVLEALEGFEKISNEKYIQERNLHEKSKKENEVIKNRIDKLCSNVAKIIAILCLFITGLVFFFVSYFVLTFFKCSSLIQHFIQILMGLLGIGFWIYSFKKFFKYIYSWLKNKFFPKN